MNTDQLHDSNRFELGNNANPQEIRYIAANFNKFLEGLAFTGVSTGLIDSPDARRTGERTLKLKLIPHEGMLVGRILATDSKTVMLPYVLGLKRAHALNVVLRERQVLLLCPALTRAKQETITLKSKWRSDP